MKKLLGVVWLSLSVSAWAGFDEGYSAYQKEDYATALKEWQPLAEQGDAYAQRNLGIMYAKGQGVRENDTEAVRWWRKAAEQKNQDAMSNLGWYTANGWGVEKNLVEAERLLKLSASQGDEWAKEKLKVVQFTQTCLKKSSTVIFGEALNCTSKDNLRSALKKGYLISTREDDGYWYDLYNSSAALEGTSELAVAYIEGKFARAYYKFDSRMNTGKVVEVRNMVTSKYGKPDTSAGDPSLGEVKYTWKLKDGIKVEVTRGWPDTTVFLTYVHPANFAAMEAEQERQKQAAEVEKHSKQNKAF